MESPIADNKLENNGKMSTAEDSLAAKAEVKLIRRERWRPLWVNFASGTRKFNKTAEKYVEDDERTKWSPWHNYLDDPTPKLPILMSSNSKGEHAYVARYRWRGQLLPGYLRDGWAYFVYGDKVLKTCHSYQLLDDGFFTWCTPGGVQEQDVIALGHDADRNPLFCGSFDINGLQVYGVVRDGVCYIAANEDVIVAEPRQYTVLSTKYASPREI